jgi:hypothetical protein
MRHFRDGTQATWQLLYNVVSVGGNANIAYASKFWTGNGTNRGWIISSDDYEPAPTCIRCTTPVS